MARPRDTDTNKRGQQHCSLQAVLVLPPTSVALMSFKVTPGIIFSSILRVLLVYYICSVTIAAAPVINDGRRTDLIQNGSNTEHYLSQRSLEPTCGPPRCSNMSCEFIPWAGCEEVCCLCNPNANEFDFIPYCMDQPINQFYNETGGQHYFCRTMNKQCEQATPEPTPTYQYDNTSANTSTIMYPFGNTSAATSIANITSQQPVIYKDEQYLGNGLGLGFGLGVPTLCLISFIVYRYCKPSKSSVGPYAPLNNQEPSRELEQTQRKAEAHQFENDFYIKSCDEQWVEYVMNHLTEKGFKGVSDQKDKIGGVSKFELSHYHMEHSNKIIIGIDQLDQEEKFNIEHALQVTLENSVDNRLILVKLKENSEVPEFLRHIPPLNAWEEKFLEEIERSVRFSKEGWKTAETDAEEEETALSGRRIDSIQNSTREPDCESRSLESDNGKMNESESDDETMVMKVGAPPSAGNGNTNQWSISSFPVEADVHQSFEVKDELEQRMQQGAKENIREQEVNGSGDKSPVGESSLESSHTNSKKSIKVSFRQLENEIPPPLPPKKSAGHLASASDFPEEAEPKDTTKDTENGWNGDSDDTETMGKETETARKQQPTDWKSLHYSKGGIGVCKYSHLRIEVTPFPLIKGQQRTVALRCYTTKDDGLKSVKICHAKGHTDVQGGEKIDMKKSGKWFMLTIDPFTELNAGIYYVEAVDKEDYLITLSFYLKFYNEIEELLKDCPLTLNKVLVDYQEMSEMFESCLNKENKEDLFRHLTGKPIGEWRESSESESAQSTIQSIASQNCQLNLSHVLQCLHVQMQMNEAVLGVEKYHKDCIACGFFYNLAHQVDCEETISLR